jgi:hypothetical protein
MMLSILSGRRWMLAGLAILIAAMVGFWQTEPAPEPPAAVVHISSSPVRFGPGKWTEPPADTVTVSDVDVPRGLATTPDQRLLVNQALHEVMDFFLLSGKYGGRDVSAKALLQYFQEKLPALAYQDASQILQQYLSYMDAHDQMLAGQAFPARGSALTERDVQRMLSWLEQRTRLRQSILGMQVTQTWYDDEDAQLKQTLNYLREAAVGGEHARFARGMQYALADAGTSFQSEIQGARKNASAR